jgi:hypothetical protein
MMVLMRVLDMVEENGCIEKGKAVKGLEGPWLL